MKAWWKSTDRSWRSGQLTNSNLLDLRIERFLSSDALGDCYRASIPDDDDPQVALRIFYPGLLDDTRATRAEALNESLRGLDSLHIVRPRRWLYDSEQQLYGAAYTWVEGQSLRDLLDAQPEGRLALPDALTLTRLLLRGLHELHAAGCAHGRLRPERIVIERSPHGPRTVRILDTGLWPLSRFDDDIVDLAAEHPEGFAEHAPYTAPEWVDGESPDAIMDVYLAALILYEMLAGRPPFQGASPSAILQRQRGEEPIPVHLANTHVTPPEELQRAIERALKKNPRARFQSAHTFFQALAAFHPPNDEETEGFLPDAVLPLPAPILDVTMSKKKKKSKGKKKAPSPSTPKKSTVVDETASAAAADEQDTRLDDEGWDLEDDKDTLLDEDTSDDDGDDDAGDDEDTSDEKDEEAEDAVTVVSEEPQSSDSSSEEDTEEGEGDEATDPPDGENDEAAPKNDEDTTVSEAPSEDDEDEEAVAAAAPAETPEPASAKADAESNEKAESKKKSEKKKKSEGQKGSKAKPKDDGKDDGLSDADIEDSFFTESFSDDWYAEDNTDADDRRISRAYLSTMNLEAVAQQEQTRRLSDFLPYALFVVILVGAVAYFQLSTEDMPDFKPIFDEVAQAEIDRQARIQEFSKRMEAHIAADQLVEASTTLDMMRGFTNDAELEQHRKRFLEAAIPTAEKFTPEKTIEPGRLHYPRQAVAILAYTDRVARFIGGTVTFSPLSRVVTRWVVPGIDHLRSLAIPHIVSRLDVQNTIEGWDAYAKNWSLVAPWADDKEAAVTKTRDARALMQKLETALTDWPKAPRKPRKKKKKAQPKETPPTDGAQPTDGTQPTDGAQPTDGTPQPAGGTPTTPEGTTEPGSQVETPSDDTQPEEGTPTEETPAPTPDAPTTP